jgi:hypothetical protein
MLLAAATLQWVLTIYDGRNVTSTTPYQTQQECEAAREAYFNQFPTHPEKLRHSATCSQPTDTME